MALIGKHVAVALTVALVIAFVPAKLAAQTDEIFDKMYPFIGYWDTDTGLRGQDRGNCGGRRGDGGEKLNNCSIPADVLPLNARGEAWLKYMDARQSPVLSECAQVSLPGVLGAGVYISGFTGRMVLYHPDPSGHVTRNVWLNGVGPTPFPGELFQHGYSVGRFDGDDLVVVTTNFTFDPDGMDDHLHMASSVRKKITERYNIIDENTMRLIITMEDPTFLKKPFVWSLLLSKQSDGIPTQWRECDADSSRREVEFAYQGTKYPDEK
jgi:hypothetical protein